MSDVIGPKLGRCAPSVGNYAKTMCHQLINVNNAMRLLLAYVVGVEIYQTFTAYLLTSCPVVF